MNRRIVIVGFMGSGKTTVAAALGRKLGCQVTDLDSFITEREGRSPAEHDRAHHQLSGAEVLDRLSSLQKLSRLDFTRVTTSSSVR